MIKSMTGYGGCREAKNHREYSVDIRSINSRYLEINLRMPKEFIMFETDVKNLVSKYINRGKIDIYISFKTFGQDDYKITPNLGLINQYLSAVNTIRENVFDVPDDFSLSSLIRLPDSLIVENQAFENQEIKEELLSCVEIAINNLNKMRESEGLALKEDILKRIDTIKDIVSEIERYSGQLVERYKEKLYKRIYENLDVKNIDENRLMLEITLFTDKSDITEEIVRLKSHIEQFSKTINSDGPIGKKLDFMLQEMNRETNTIGSKSVIYEISSCVVNLKDQLEKIREQVQNIE
ncbi:YicC/YloC family endoribonuclease [Caldicellulosiruptoraceae bacterium PP1]